MSHFLDNLTYFTRKRPETFSDGHGITTMGMVSPQMSHATGNVPTANAGRMTRSSVLPMV